MQKSWRILTRFGLAIVFLLSVFLLAACGGDASGKAPVNDTPPDLKGEWKQVNSNSEDSYQSATISDGMIEVYWVTEDEKALYWAGTYEAPTSASEPYSWSSQNDHEKTDMALLASGDDQKTFTYEDGQISYEVSLMGTTSTIKLEKE